MRPFPCLMKMNIPLLFHCVHGALSDDCNVRTHSIPFLLLLRNTAVKLLPLCTLVATLSHDDVLQYTLSSSRRERQH